MERSRSPVSPEVKAFVAKILEPDPIWEAYVERPRQRLISTGYGPRLHDPRNPDDSRSESRSPRISPEVESFLARLTGRPTDAHVAAFVAAITGEGDSAIDLQPYAESLREHNFNPSEPRDRRGRWTTGSSDDTPSGAGEIRRPNTGLPAGMGIAGQGGPSGGGDDTPELPPERKAQLARASAELDALVAAGKLSKAERDLRYELVKAALGHKMGFSIKQKPNPAYFGSRINNDGDDEYYLLPGQATAGIHDRVYRKSDIGSDTGCTRAAQSLMLEAQAQLAKQQGKSAQFDKAVAGTTLQVLFPDEQSSSYQEYTGNHKDGLDPNTFIPGERVWMQNHMHRRGVDERGFEGSNVIYAGKDENGVQQFVHMDGGDIVDEQQLKKDVQGYSGKDRQDPNTDNYRFKERYSPKPRSF